jgi:hypothetical protein
MEFSPTNKQTISEKNCRKQNLLRRPQTMTSIARPRVCLNLPGGIRPHFPASCKRQVTSRVHRFQKFRELSVSMRKAVFGRTEKLLPVFMGRLASDEQQSYDYNIDSEGVL